MPFMVLTPLADNSAARGLNKLNIDPRADRLLSSLRSDCRWGKEPFCRSTAGDKNKKNDVAEYRKAFGHVGLLVNKPPGPAGLPSI
jgi:hypothetical protein